MIVDATDLIKLCPFSTDKKGKHHNCFGGCALYVGKHPYGNCALYLAGVNTLPTTDQQNDKEE